VRVALVGAGERAAKERDRFRGEPGGEALLGERDAVVDAPAYLELVHPRAQVLVRVEGAREVARRAPRTDRLARPREHLEEVVGEAAGDREGEDDEHPVARRARAVGVDDEEQLNEDVQREREGHAVPLPDGRNHAIMEGRAGGDEEQRHAPRAGGGGMPTISRPEPSRRRHVAARQRARLARA